MSAAPASPNEEAIERALRPKLFNEYVGQTKVREQLEIFIGAARKRSEAMDHVLLFGPPGLVSCHALIDRIAALVPPPSTHRHRYFGVLAPNSHFRAEVTDMALAAPAQATPAQPAQTGTGVGGSNPARATQALTGGQGGDQVEAAFEQTNANWRERSISASAASSS